MNSLHKYLQDPDQYKHLADVKRTGGWVLTYFICKQIPLFLFLSVQEVYKHMPHVSYVSHVVSPPPPPPQKKIKIYIYI